MKRYRAFFRGRRAGAIGIPYDHCETIEAPNAKSARLKLYETHEHISGLRLVALKHGNKLLRDMREIFDRGDPWGSCMGAWFAVAGEMFSRGLNIPGDWQYSPGAAGDGRDPASSEYEYCEQASDSDLADAGDILARYSRMLRHAGRDY